MNKLLFIPSLTFILIVIACTDQLSHSATIFIQNTSAHDISIKFYYQGAIQNGFTVFVLSGQTKKVYSDGGEGKSRINYYATTINNLDSAIINFGEIKQMAHYSFTLANKGTNNMAIPFDNNRSLFNQVNYTSKTIFENESTINLEYLFTITEEDYLHIN
jgi:hypothetical protein